MYFKLIKRLLDIIVSLTALVILLPLMIVLSFIGMIVMGGNPFFIQKRPGLINKKTGKERVFSLLKFRTMTNKKDHDGKLIPDEERLVPYGRFLRSTSLDELPSLINILLGSLSIVGPRPFLIKDLLFMSDEQRRRHSVRPGLTGLAQVNGRNNISWFQKFDYDLQYIDNGITFIGDIKIVLKTIKKVLKRSDIVRNGTVSDIDYGDWLLQSGYINIDEFNSKKKV